MNTRTVKPKKQRLDDGIRCVTTSVLLTFMSRPRVSWWRHEVLVCDGCCESDDGDCGKSRLDLRCRVSFSVTGRAMSRRVRRVGRCTCGGRLVTRLVRCCVCCLLCWSAMFTFWRWCEWCGLGVRPTGIYTPTTKTPPPPTSTAVGQPVARSTLSLVLFLSPRFLSLYPPWTWPRTISVVCPDAPPSSSTSPPSLFFSGTTTRGGVETETRLTLIYIIRRL